MVDAGAREGPRKEWLELGLRVVGFEPDPGECAWLSTSYAAHKFLPLALDSSPGIRVLNITENPLCSSFYFPLQQLVDAGISWLRFYQRKQVKTTTLDIWVRENQPDDWPEFIKLDTQGSELDILRGATEALSHAEIVMSEVEFNPLYESQPLFGDVDSFLRTHGFQLVGFQDLNYLFSRLYWADAYWAKIPLTETAQKILKRVGVNHGC